MRLIPLLIVMSTAACTTDARLDERRFQLAGVVVGRESSSRMVIAHEAVTGLMPAMSMPFDLRGHAVPVRDGDRITATLVVSDSASWLEDVKVVGPDGAGTVRQPAATRASPGGIVPVLPLVDQDGAPTIPLGGGGRGTPSSAGAPPGAEASAGRGAGGGRGRVPHNDPASPESRLLGAAVQSVPDRVRAASPMAYIGRDAPPFLIMHGLADNSVPHGQSVLLYEALKAAGHDVTLRLVDGLLHTFFNRTDLDDVAGPFQMQVREHRRAGGDQAHRAGRRLRGCPRFLPEPPAVETRRGPNS